MPDRADYFRVGIMADARFVHPLLCVVIPVAALRKTPLLWVVSFTTIFYVDSFQTPPPEIGVISLWGINVSLGYERGYADRNTCGIRPESGWKHRNTGIIRMWTSTSFVVIHILCVIHTPDYPGVPVFPPNTGPDAAPA